METLQGVRGACFLGLFACTVIICWVPLLSVAAVLLYFSIKDVQTKQYPECEIPLDLWALVLASTVLALTLVQAVLYCLTSCKIATTPAARPSRGGSSRAAGDDGARTPLQRQRSSGGGGGADPDEDKKGKGKLTTLIPCGQCCTLVVRDGAVMSDGEEKLSCGFKVVTGIVAAFIFAWLIVGAMWVLPFREQHMTSHHCNPYLLGFSFYLLIAALIAIFAAMSCCCLLACASLTVGATVWAAVDGLVRKLFAWLGIDPAWANTFGLKLSSTPSEDSVKAAAAAGAVARTVVEKSAAQAAAAAGAASAAGGEDGGAAAAADAVEKGAGTGIATAGVSVSGGGDAGATAATTTSTAGGAGGAGSWYDTPGAAQRAVTVGTHFVHAFQEHVAPALAAAAAAQGQGQGAQQRAGAAGGSSGASTAAAVAASLATAAASTLAAAQAPAAASRPAPVGLRTGSVRAKAFNHGADVPPTGGAVHVDSGVVVGSTGIHPAVASGSGGRPPVVFVADSEESEDDERRRLTAATDHAARQQALAGVHAVLVGAPPAAAAPAVAQPARIEAVMVQKPADAADVDLVDALDDVIASTGSGSGAAGRGGGGGGSADDNNV